MGARGGSVILLALTTLCQHMVIKLLCQEIRMFYNDRTVKMAINQVNSL